MNRLYRYFILGVSVAFLATACGDDAPQKNAAEVIIKVKTADGQGKAVPMVLFFINGKKYGITGEDGLVRVPYPAKAGETLVFDVEDPDGYRVPATTDRGQWKVTVDELGSGPVVIEFPVVFERPERDYVMLVKVAGENLPVTINGKKVGATNAKGDAILKVKGVPGQSFTARAGDAVLKGGEFAQSDEVYVLTNGNVGRIGKTMSVVAEPATPKADVKTKGSGARSGAIAQNTKQPKRRNIRRDEDLFQPEPRRAARPSRTVINERPQRPEPEPKPRYTEPKRTDRRDTNEVRFGGTTQRRDPAPEPVARPKPTPAPAPVPTPAAKSGPINDGLDELLGDDEPEVAARPVAPKPTPIVAPSRPTPPVAVKTAGRRPSPRRAAESMGDGLLDDADGETVDRSAIDSKVTIGGRSGDSPSALSKEQVTARLNDIKNRLKTTRVVDRRDAEFLSQVSAKHPGYYEANRILGDWYFQLKDYKRQAKVLEVATKRGRLKSDPIVLLSLAKAYGKQKNYRRAIRAMNRVERKMRRLSAPLKADAYRFHAEMLEFEFLRQYHDDPKRANTSLIDKAITRWQRFRTFNKGSGRAVREAESKIEKLNTLKNEMEL